jgi:hypothetical protein
MDLIVPFDSFHNGWASKDKTLLLTCEFRLEVQGVLVFAHSLERHPRMGSSRGHVLSYTFNCGWHLSGPEIDCKGPLDSCPRMVSRTNFAGMTVGTHHLIPAAHQVQDRSRQESTGLRYLTFLIRPYGSLLNDAILVGGVRWKISIGKSASTMWTETCRMS